MTYDDVIAAAWRILPLLQGLLPADQADVVAERLMQLLERASDREPGVDDEIVELLSQYEPTRVWMRAALTTDARVERSFRAESPSGAAPSPPELKLRPTAGHVRVRIFYATDRKPTGKHEPADFYAGVRNDDETLALGVCEVSIPATHSKGQLESPAWQRFEFRPDPDRHVVLLSVTTMDEDGFFADVGRVVAQSEGKDAFVFLHGYNVTFEDAARRTAQLAYDLAFRGAPILYSWPSHGRILSYGRDEQQVEWTVPHLKQFLAAVTARTGAERVHLIAHSMGNRALTSALKELALERRTLDKVHHVVLTAPDIDAAVFRQLADRLGQAAKQVTLYASSKDTALWCSKRFHGYARAGDSGEGLVVLPSLDTVDASPVDTSFLGHSYFGSNRTVLTDIISLFAGVRPAKRPDLEAVTATAGAYWRFRR